MLFVLRSSQRQLSVVRHRAGPTCVLPSPALHALLAPFFFPLPFLLLESWRSERRSPRYVRTHGTREFWWIAYAQQTFGIGTDGRVSGWRLARHTAPKMANGEGRNHGRLAVASAVGEEEPAAPAEEINRYTCMRFSLWCGWGLQWASVRCWVGPARVILGWFGFCRRPCTADMEVHSSSACRAMG